MPRKDAVLAAASFCAMFRRRSARTSGCGRGRSPRGRRCGLAPADRLPAVQVIRRGVPYRKPYDLISDRDVIEGIAASVEPQAANIAQEEGR